MATYYVRADGAVLAANKASATSPNSAATSLSRSQANACTFAPGDVVLYSSQGGLFDNSVIPPTGGVSGNKIRYANVPGERPKVRGTANGLFVVRKSYVDVEGFDIEYTGTNIYANGLAVDQATTGATVGDINIDMNGYGYGLVSSAQAAGLTIHDVNIVDTGAGAQSLYVYGASSSNVTIQNVSVTGLASIHLANIAGLTIENLTKNGAAAGAPDIFLSAITGLLSVDGIASTGAGLYGLHLSGCVLTGDSEIANVTVAGASQDGVLVQNSSGFLITGGEVTANGASGFRVMGTSHDVDFSYNLSSQNAGAGFKVGGDGTAVYNITYLKDVAEENGGDGFMTGGAGSADHDVTHTDTIARGNGTESSTYAGDGYTAHGNDYNINCIRTIADGNICSGYAMVGNSSGRIINAIAQNNGGDFTGSGGADQIRGGVFLSLDGANPTTSESWEVKNTIIGGNYPADTNVSSACAAIVDLNYNCYAPGGVVSLNGMSTTQTVAAYVAASESNSIVANPLIGTDYKPSMNSSCVGAGVDVELTTDAAGGSLPTPWGYDIGPYSFGSVADAGWSAWTTFATMPTLSLAPTAPGKLLEVQEWSKPVTKKQIDGVR